MLPLQSAIFLVLVWSAVLPAHAAEPTGIDAAQFGFSPSVTGAANSDALQKALDHGGLVQVTAPGTYPIAKTVFIGSNTHLVFGPGVFLKKVVEADGPFASVILNKGALSRTWDSNIEIDGLQIVVNGVDIRKFLVYGLHGQLALFYVNTATIRGFRCLDLGRMQYAIHVCTFKNLTVNDVVVEGNKDGVHLGRGSHFHISDCHFETGDDAVALNGHDYATGNPELGWIEDGVIENCWTEPHGGYFCRILAGAWTDWHAGMRVQQSDTVAHNGLLYRVQMQPDGHGYVSNNPPAQTSGSSVVDGITWGVIQKDDTRTAGVRHVVFRNIHVLKPTTVFSIHFDNDKYSRSYYPDSPVPLQQELTFDNIDLEKVPTSKFLQVSTPVDSVHITNCTFRTNPIQFIAHSAVKDYGPTNLTIDHCNFHVGDAPFSLLTSRQPRKDIDIDFNKNSGDIPQLRVDPGSSIIRWLSTTRLPVLQTSQ